MMFKLNVSKTENKLIDLDEATNLYSQITQEAEAGG